MRKVYDYLAGLYFGCQPVILTLSIGFLISNAFQHWIAYCIALILQVPGVLVGLFFLKTTRSIGFIEFATALCASPDLDNPKVIPGSNHVARNPRVYAELIKRGVHLCKNGSLRIFGDWFGERNRNPLVITSAEFNKTLNQLIIAFKTGEKMYISNPKHIHETSSYLKVIDAKKIKIECTLKGETGFISYEKTKRNISIKTSFTKQKFNFDVYLGMPALFIYGDFS